jgi:hypothetical protein
MKITGLSQTVSIDKQLSEVSFNVLAVTIQVWTVEQMKKNTERSIGD